MSFRPSGRAADESGMPPRGATDRRPLSTVQLVLGGLLLVVMALGDGVTRFNDRYWITIRAEDDRGYHSVSDDGLKHLESVKSLKKLITYQTSVTDSGISSLQEKVPDVEVINE